MTATVTRPRERFEAIVERLNRQSVDKHFDAFEDIPWDDPDHAIDHDDPRWEYPVDSPLGATDWYRSQPAGVRRRLGLHDIVCTMTAGYQFENILQRGLLEHAFRLPPDAPDLRYAYHEIIEEGQHTQMFTEFIRRAGLPPQGLAWDLRLGSRFVVGLARRFPSLFFVFVLGGEDPIDHRQRTLLRTRDDLHPLTERIMRIHVTEEARHLSFARQYLRLTVPKLNRGQRTVIRWMAPAILGVMAQVMMRPNPVLVTTYGIPKDVLAEAYGPGTRSRQEVRDSLAKVRRLLVELGLVSRPSTWFWKRLDIWDEPTPTGRPTTDDSVARAAA